MRRILGSVAVVAALGFAVALVGSAAITLAMFAAASNLIVPASSSVPHAADRTLVGSSDFSLLAPGPYCKQLRNRADRLLPFASACQSDGDCFYYPCSCSTLGRIESSKEYVELRERLQSDCGETIYYALCMDTRLACEQGSCVVIQDFGRDTLLLKRLEVPRSRLPEPTRYSPFVGIAPLAPTPTN